MRTSDLSKIISLLQGVQIGKDSMEGIDEIQIPIPPFWKNPFAYLRARNLQNQVSTTREMLKKRDQMKKLNNESLGVSSAQPYQGNGCLSFIEESESIFRLKRLDRETTPIESVIMWQSAQHPDADIHESYYEYLTSHGHREVPCTALVDAVTFEQQYIVLMASDCTAQKRAALGHMAQSAVSTEEYRFVIHMSHMCGSGDIKAYAVERLLCAQKKTKHGIKGRALYMIGFGDPRETHKRIKQLLRNRGRLRNIEEAKRKTNDGEETGKAPVSDDHVLSLSDFRK